MNGRSQAVRLPKKFRFEGDEVSVSKEGDAVVLRPINRRSWPKGFFEAIRIDNPAFVRPEQPESPEIEAL